MSYWKMKNVNIRENGKKRNLFDKVNELKQKIYMLMPEIDGEKLIIIMSHIRRDYEGNLFYGRHGKTNKKVELTHTEHLIKELLLKEGMNPLSRFNFGRLSSLEHVDQWQAKERQGRETM